MTTVLEKPTQRRHRRSNSQLNDYLKCGWSFRLKRIMKVAERPSVWLAGGKAFHLATEDFDRACWGDDIHQWAGDRDQWRTAFDVRLEEMLDEIRTQHPDIDPADYRSAGRKTKDKPRGEDLAWWAENGPVMVNRYIDWRISIIDTLDIATVDGDAGVEIEVTITVDGVEVIGYVDRLFVDKTTAQLLVVDLKTGSRMPDSPLQLATYSLPLEQLTGRPVSWGAYFDARKGTLSAPEDLTLWTTEKLGVIYDGLDRGVSAGVFIPNITSMCKACAVRHACVFQGGVEPRPQSKE